MDSPLGPMLANVFLAHFEKTCLQNFPSDLWAHYYRRYVDHIFALFTSPIHLEDFRDFLHAPHANKFTIEMGKQNRMSFLDVQIIREDKTFTTSVYLNLPLVEFIHILTVFYHLPISSVLFTHSLIDACEFAPVGLNYTMKQFV